MKRILLYCILFGCALMVPIKKIDISDLEPIQAVRMYREDGKIILETDTEDYGIGENVKEALADMKQSSEGIVYLDTAQFLVVAENALDDIAHIKPFLKEKVQVCLSEGMDKLSTVAKYMKAHDIGVKLKQWHKNLELPQLPDLPGEES